MTQLPAEAELRALSQRFAQGEKRIKALVARAPNGNRRALLAEALAVLLGLRREAAGAGAYVEHAYAVAALAVARLTGLSVPSNQASDLGRSLALRLDQSLARAERESRAAFAAVLTDTIEEAQAAAVTARVDRLGRRYGIGDQADLLTRTIGRHAVTRGTYAALPRGALVEISGGSCPICIPLQGIRSINSSGPPFHPKCGCSATPVGY